MSLTHRILYPSHACLSFKVKLDEIKLLFERLRRHDVLLSSIVVFGAVLIFLVASIISLLAVLIYIVVSN
jgi:hypothetical protein